MTWKNIAAAILVAGGATTTLALAVPATADPAGDAQSQQIDQVFLQALTKKGVATKSDQFAIALAHSTCETLAQTSSIPTTLRYIKNQTDWSDTREITSFGSLAVQAYCPSAMPKSSP